MPDQNMSAAEAYRHSREVPLEGLTSWRDAIARHLDPGPVDTVVDVGAGTGGFALALRRWLGVRVVAVEPDPAMRALIPAAPGLDVLDGRGESLPLPDASVNGAWLASVMHHLDDLSATATELRRVVRPGGVVLIRNTFPGRCARDLRVRYFPEIARQVEGYPSVEQVCSAFARVGFEQVALEQLAQRSAPTLQEWARRLNRDTDSKLRRLTDEEYAAGLARLAEDIRADPELPAVSWMDLLVLRSRG